MSVQVRILYAGNFYLSKDKFRYLSYRKGLVYSKKEVDPDLLSKIELEDFIKEGVGSLSVIELWFCKSGTTLDRGIQQITCDKDILELCSTAGTEKTIDVYVVQKGEESPSLLLGTSKAQSGRANANVLSPSSRDMSNVAGPSIISDECNQNPRGVTSKTSHLPSTFSNKSSNVSLGSPKTLFNLPPNWLSSLPSTSKKPLLTSANISDYENSTSDEDEDDVELLGSETSDDDDSSEDGTYEENVFGDETDDDADFEDNVDKVVVDENVTNDDGEENIEDVFDVRVDTDDYRSYSTGSDEEVKLRYPEFNPLVDGRSKICFKSGMVFGSNDVFRKALRQYAVEHGFDYYYLHNDGTRVSAYCINKCACAIKHGRKKCACKENICGFKACARRIGSDGTFQLKSFVSKHTCGWQDKNTKMTSNWLAEKYLEHYRDDPLWRIQSFMTTVKRDYSVEISYHQAWRARMKAVLMTQGFAPEQYARVWDYAATLHKWNPGSSIFVRPQDSPERPLKFQRFYVCLSACKEGFMTGCRPILGLDGCHLKGAYTGKVLTAVGNDGNENIFPVAFAVVEQENKEAWCWFLQLLVNDVGSKALTFMSDRQKGLLEALAEIVPMADTRVCVRHMHNNFKKQWPGKSFKDAVWSAAKASTLADFQGAMRTIRDMNVDAHDYLMRQDPTTWSVHAFRHYSKSDMLLNNACESFSSCILEARQMPILSMCEWIRRKLMRMFISKRNKMRAHLGFLTPEAMSKLDAIKLESLYRCKCHGDGDLYEVDASGMTYVVNLQQRSCGCNMWDITGIPCAHAICCILKRRLRLEEFVSPYYHKETYMRAYQLSVSVMPGQDQWETTVQPPLDPPKLVIQPGRPKKKRTKEVGEKSKTKSTRVRHGKNKCGNCGEEGHTRKICKNPAKEPEAPTTTKRGGRPPKESTLPTQIQKRKYTRRKVRTTEPEPSNRGALENENDPDVQSMIETAMREENVIPTQVSQTPMPLPTSQLNPFQSQASTSTHTTGFDSGSRKKAKKSSRSNFGKSQTRTTRSSTAKK